MSAEAGPIRNLSGFLSTRYFDFLARATTNSVLEFTIVFPAARTFVLRLQIAKDRTGELFVKETDSTGTVILMEKRERVSSAEIDRFLEVVERGDFWKLPTREQADKYINDGSYWFIEGTSQGKYHMVYRRAPDSGPFTEIGRCLVKDLARLPNSVIRLQDEGRPQLIRRAKPD
jgi:hypothetical protein